MERIAQLSRNFGSFWAVLALIFHFGEILGQIGTFENP